MKIVATPHDLRHRPLHSLTALVEGNLEEEGGQRITTWAELTPKQLREFSALGHAYLAKYTPDQAGYDWGLALLEAVDRSLGMVLKGFVITLTYPSGYSESWLHRFDQCESVPVAMDRLLAAIEGLSTQGTVTTRQVWAEKPIPREEPHG